MKREDAIRVLVEAVRNAPITITRRLREAIKVLDIKDGQIGAPEATIEMILQAAGKTADEDLNRDQLYHDLLLTISMFKILTIKEFGSTRGARERIEKLIAARHHARALQDLLADETLHLKHVPRIKSLGVPARLELIIELIDDMPGVHWTPSEAVAAAKSHFGFWVGKSPFESLAGGKLVEIYQELFHEAPKRSRKSGNADASYDSYVRFVLAILLAFNIGKNKKKLTEQGSHAYQPEAILKALPSGGEN